MKVSYLAGMDVSTAGLIAQRTVMNVASENLANLNTTRTESGDPYRRQVVSLEAQKLPATLSASPAPLPGIGLDRTDPMHLQPVGLESPLAQSALGVVGKVSEDQSEFPSVYDPGHPDADENGMVRMPNVDLAQEMVTLLAASRAYEANVAALQTARKMAEGALSLAR
ncbi:MAG: flagellar basal body rod protein FlgC [Candidatus Eisenbacteria bacterium]